MHRILLYGVAGCFSLVFLALVYLYATGVNQNDVLAQYDLGAGVADVGVRAGDVYWISPDGKRGEPICRLSLNKEFVNDAPVDAVYRNSLSSLLPGFQDFVKAGFGLIKPDPSGSNETIEVTSIVSQDDKGYLRLTGHFTQLKENTERAGIPDSCECEMARFLNKRHRVCTVRSSLVPASDPNLSAFNFASFSNMVPAQKFEQCGLQKSDAATVVELEPCPASMGHSWDVTLRKMLGVVVPVTQDTLTAN